MLQQYDSVTEHEYGVMIAHELARLGTQQALMSSISAVGIS